MYICHHSSWEAGAGGLKFMDSLGIIIIIIMCVCLFTGMLVCRYCKGQRTSSVFTPQGLSTLKKIKKTGSLVGLGIK